MDTGEVRAVETGQCRDLYVLETGMYGVTGYGAVYIIDAERPAIVETGTGRNAELILEGLRTVGIDADDVEVIAVTHVHLDHAGGAGQLAAACEQATVVAHERGVPHLVDPSRLVEGTKRAVGDQWRYYDDPRPISEERMRAIADGGIVDLGNYELRAVAAPGHAPHQVMYHLPGMGAVFTGDAAGIWVHEQERIVQSSPPPNFDLEQAVADLDALDACDPDTLLFTHFGPAPYTESFPSTYERVLRGWVRSVERVRERSERDEHVIEWFVDRAPMHAGWSPERVRAETSLNVRGVLTYLDRHAPDA